LIDYSLAVHGLSRHLSTHAAGVLISDKPLVTYTPLQRAPRGEGLISQYCMEDVEAIGLLKLDVLGLSTLTVLDRAFRWIEQTTGEQLTPKSIPLDDPDTFALLSAGEVTAIFQVESGGMRRTLREMQPSEFRDIVAVLSLYRPGPMQFIPNYINRKFGREEVTYHHPLLEPILAETYGIIVYQEQIIRIARDLAGYTPGEADLMRRAVGKKKQKDLEKQHNIFLKGAVEHGVPEEAAEKIFADIELFANYGFNKSHSAAYAVITLQTAYLKAHYPIEFMTAMLSVERGNTEKVVNLVTECRRLGIEIRQPDINCSDVDFTIEPVEWSDHCGRHNLLGQKELAIRFGLGAIKNVGDGPAQIIVDARGDEPFADLDDFIRRVDLRHLNKRVLECLVCAGALDRLGERNALLSALDQMIAQSQETHRAKEIGQTSLFDFSPNLMGQAAGATFALPKDVPPMPEKKRLAEEKELLGIYMSAHPLNQLSQYVDERLTPLSDIDPTMEGSQIQVAGVVNGVRVITTKKGDNMAFVQFEDPSGSMELVVFPRTYELSKELLGEGSLLLVHAKVDVRDEDTKLIADSIEPYQLPKDARKRRPSGKRPASIRVDIPLSADATQAKETVHRVYSLLTANSGSIPFRFCLTNHQGRVEIEFPNAATSYTTQLEQQVTALLGANRLHVDWA
ncbi:MAG: DNA polymerase III subunit alpha, partial [Chloroflexi bacterium]|nr:DNA polymerase III subunit alpha [Chloroflexota bacterium]